MILRRGPQAVLLVAMMVAAAAGCRKDDDDEADQIGASVGEAMSSLDESVAGGAATAMLPVPAHARRSSSGPLWRRAMDSVDSVRLRGDLLGADVLGVQRVGRTHEGLRRVHHRPGDAGRAPSR